MCRVGQSQTVGFSAPNAPANLKEPAAVASFHAGLRGILRNVDRMLTFEVKFLTRWQRTKNK